MARPWPLVLVVTAACTCGERPALARPAPPPAEPRPAGDTLAPAVLKQESERDAARTPVGAGGVLTRFTLGLNEGIAVPARLREGMERSRVELRLAEDAGAIRGLGGWLVRAHTFNFPRVSCSALREHPEARDDLDSWVRALGPDLEGVAMVSPWPGNHTGTYTKSYLPTDMPAFEACVRGLVERYDGDGVDDMPGLTRPVRFWEVDNEPDLKNSNVSRSAEVSYDPTTFCTPQEYATLLLSASRAIRAANPSARVLALGLYRPHAERGQAYARGVLSQPGVLDAFDILSLHTYQDDDGERLAEGVRTVGAMAPGKPIWVTETSVGTQEGEDEQARRVAAIVAHAAEAGAEAVFWHTLADPPVRPGERPKIHLSTNSLLAGRDRGPPGDKPAARVYRALAARLDQDDLRGAVPAGSGATRLRSGAVLLHKGSRVAPRGGTDLRTGEALAPGAMAQAPAWIDPG